MSINVDLGDVVTALALLLSIYATMKTVRFNEKQKSLIESQERLNNLLLEKEAHESSNDKMANLGASFIKLGSNKYRLKIWNMGKAVARNIVLEFPEGNDVVLKSELDEKFPMEVLDVHQSVELIAAVHMGSKLKLPVRIVWADDFSDRNEKLTYPTL
ncbi:MAG TPA: hypothetical protein VH814_15395 [Steroidobacteraceae bacterium]|jgi:hypothetical protein